MYGMEIDIIYSKHKRLVFRSWRLVASMAFERKVVPKYDLLTCGSLNGNWGEKVQTVHPSHRHIWGGIGQMRKTWCVRATEPNLLNGYATFYAAHSKAGAGRKTGYHARLPL